MYLGYQRESKAVQVPTAIRTTQAKIKQTMAQIERERRKSEDERHSKHQKDVLLQKYRLLEKDLYKQ